MNDVGLLATVPCCNCSARAPELQILPANHYSLSQSKPVVSLGSKTKMIRSNNRAQVYYVLSKRLQTPMK